MSFEKQKLVRGTRKRYNKDVVLVWIEADAYDPGVTKIRTNSVTQSEDLEAKQSRNQRDIHPSGLGRGRLSSILQ